MQPAEGVGQPLLAQWLEQVVDRTQGEGVDGGVLVGRDEHDSGRFGEPGEHLREVEPGQPRHPDVEEHHVVRRGFQLAQRPDGVARRAHLTDPRVGAQEVGELVQGGWFVVDGEHAQAHEARTPAVHFGIRRVTLVPAPSAVSTSRPCSSP